MWFKSLPLLTVLTSAFISQAYSVQAAESYCPPRAATAAEQEEIFKRFYQRLWVEKDVVGAFTEHVSPDYIQHNPYATSGRQSALDYLTPRWPGWKFTLAHFAFSNGYGWVHVKQELIDEPEEPFEAVVDILRMNGTCIVEHWDVIQSLPDDAINPGAFF